MSWLDTTEYNPKEICPLCLRKYTKAKGVYQILPCKHIFHNDCLNDYCEHQNGTIKCPVCRSDAGQYTCMDVWAFKNYALDPSSLNRNRHLLKIYNKNKPPAGGGKKQKEREVKIEELNEDKPFMTISQRVYTSEEIKCPILFLQWFIFPNKRFHTSEYYSKIRK